MKNKIALIKLGYVDRFVNFNKIKKWKSDLFEVTEIYCREYLPESDVDDNYFDLKYTKNKLGSIISCPSGSDFAVAIMPYRLVDNFYMHRVGGNCVIISLYEISDILIRDQISMENFITKQLYEICALKYLAGDLSSDEVYNFVHRDTRGCLFDMNGERTNILYNTEKPIICDSCKDRFKKEQINAKVISVLEKELKKIKKPPILQIEKHIKKYPLATMIMSGIVAIILNLLANLLWDIFKKS
ncbi:hypothetical protein Palpr_0524 [Paludibacter propionicigenes WB4]|uniref:Uncharacterized protein n=1 Tax=Paludibacter propionicigenes (strain DSM 17365 / JCM 13257 / WB4) TaxID=694427 RepID=E4T1T9_PALPW|nr:hypothetical protein [Paludibacter propionicigenes]ADQ78683.1 hypothetical protein Palpr_0524 [Paludibacter propionicigenes WB4]